MTTKKAIKHLTSRLKRDAGYWESWKANIAMCCIDNERWHREKTKRKVLNKKDRHTIANDAAENFLQLLCD